MEGQIGLGDRVKDNITGFTGIATGRIDYLYGCVRFLVTPEKIKKDEKPEDAVIFDELQLTLMKKKVVVNPLREELPAPNPAVAVKRHRDSGGPVKSIPARDRLDRILRSQVRL